MNHNEAEVIAAAVAIIRPDWLQSSLVTLMGKYKHKPARDVALALVWIAYDPETTSPGRLDVPGPWWELSRVAGLSDTSALPYYDRAPVVSEQHPVTDVETIRAIRAAAKAAAIEGAEEE